MVAGGWGRGGEVTDYRLLWGSAVRRVLPEAITASHPPGSGSGGEEAEPLHQISGVISVHGVAAQT